MQLDRRQREGLVLIFLVVLGYSLFSVWVRMMSDSGMNAIDIATWRFSIALALLWIFLWVRGPKQAHTLPRRSLALAGGLMMLAGLTAIYGLQLLSTPLFILLAYTYPAMVALFATVRGERLEPAAWLALGVMGVGVAFAAGDVFGDLQESPDGVGVLMGLLNALIVAVYFMLMSHLMRGVSDTPRATGYTVLGAAIPTLLLIPLRGLQAPPTAEAWLGLLGLSLVSTVIPIVCLSAGIQRLGAPRTAIFATLELVLVMVWSELLLGDRVTLGQGLGAVLIFASVVILQWHQSRPRIAALVVGQADT